VPLTTHTRLGRYELLCPLAVGGMAEVFKARVVGSAGFTRDVVIKRILPAHGRDPEFVRMFVDEARILGMLHHPNVAQAYDFGEEDGTLYLALEYVAGLSLSRVMRALRSSSRQMPPAIVAYLAREVCRALDYVHTARDAQGTPLGVIHRDVTPSNVMLTPTGGVKLLDFGVAKFTAAGGLTKAGTVKGKPAYLAPEQLDGKKIDGRVDLFALGILMHEMLSLQHLFAGDSDLGTMKKVMEMEIVQPSSQRADLPPALDQIVMKALERDRERRYASAAEMGRALDDFVIASQLRMDEVVAFVREVEAQAAAQAPCLAACAPAELATVPTRRDLGLAVRMWTKRRLLGGARVRDAAVAAVALVAVGLTIGLGAGARGASSEPPVAMAKARAGVITSLSRLHHLARREIQLDLLGQVAAVRSETTLYATEFERAFSALDGRVVALAGELGTEESQLRKVYAAENAIALRDEAKDLDDLSMILGEDFDRQFWALLARDHEVASELLTSVPGTDPRLRPLTTEASRLLERSYRKAMAAGASVRPDP